MSKKTWPDVSPYRPKVAEIIKYSGPISAIDIAKKLGLTKDSGFPNRAYPVTMAITYMNDRNWLNREGQSHGVRYSFNEHYKDQLNPLNPYNVIEATPSVVQVKKKEKAVLVPHAVVEISKCALKLLVKQVMDDNPNIEGELQRAVMKALLLLV